MSRFRPIHMVPYYFILVLSLTVLSAATSEGQSNEERVAWERDLERMGHELQKAVLEMDIGTLSKYRIGESVDDPTYDSNENLKNPKSFRYCYLFDTT